MGFALAAVIACSSSPTAPGEPVLLVGELPATAANSHALFVESSGIMTITIEDLRAILWDVTFAGVGDLTLGFGVGEPEPEGSCAITGQLLVREGDTYLWSIRSGEHCVLLFDSGIIPADGVLGYSVLLEPPA